MITLFTKSLKEFQKKSAFVQNASILPILNNVKLDQRDDGFYITKNSLRHVCEMKVEGSATFMHVPVLISEQELFSLVNNTTEEEITIEQLGKKCIVTAGTSKLQFFPEDAKHFPPTPQPDGEKHYAFTEEVIDAMRVAKSFCAIGDDKGNFQLVHLDKDKIYALNTFYFYFNVKFKELPSVSVWPREVDFLTEGMKLFDNSNQRVYVCDGLLVSIAKEEFKLPNVSGLVERYLEPTDEINFPKSEFLEFLRQVNSGSKSKMPICTFDNEGLTFNDADSGRKYEKEISLDGKMIEPFKFNSRIVFEPVKAIPYPVLIARRAGVMLTFQNVNDTPAEFFGFAGIIKNT